MGNTLISRRMWRSLSISKKGELCEQRYTGECGDDSCRVQIFL